MSMGEIKLYMVVKERNSICGMVNGTQSLRGDVNISTERYRKLREGVVTESLPWMGMATRGKGMDKQDKRLPGRVCNQCVERCGSLIIEWAGMNGKDG